MLHFDFSGQQLRTLKGKEDKIHPDFRSYTAISEVPALDLTPYSCKGATHQQLGNKG
jgi:hypothetical protein